ncbi:hypothetical protein [Roseomonas elaeocarpi]|uniref:Uncharacterized protein n=1 Tax=Roseomonas elaeocarpi TaxID=907779 RepID=A0ABV6JYF2_9PROT
MQTYRLKPVERFLSDPSWLASRYLGECIVVAECAAAARRYANGTFALPVWHESAGPVPSLPWSQPHLVEVRQATPGQASYGQALPQRQAVPASLLRAG